MLAAREAIAQGYDDILVLFADTPLVDGHFDEARSGLGFNVEPRGDTVEPLAGDLRLAQRLPRGTLAAQLDGAFQLQGGFCAIQSGQRTGAGQVLQLGTEHERWWQGFVRGAHLDRPQLRRLRGQRAIAIQCAGDGGFKAQGFSSMRRTCHTAHPGSRQDGSEMQ